MSDEPTISDLLTAGVRAINGTLDKSADFVRGSDYESLIGPSAVLFSREGYRDTDLFNAVNFQTADGQDLTIMAKKRFGKSRLLDSRGQGFVYLQRASGGVADTIWKGHRFSLVGSSSLVYRATQRVDVLDSDLNARVPIEAIAVGPGVAARVTSGVRIDDLMQDSSWQVTGLECVDGTLFEPAEVFRARIRQERQDDRVGQSKALVKTCNDAGAVNVVLFRSDYAGDAYDHGLNFCYVGDLGYSSTPELVKACTLALRKTRVAGDHMQVLPMARVTLDVTADVYLYDNPALFDLSRFERVHTAAVRQYLNGASGRFTFSLDGIRGAIARPSPEVQRVVLTTPTSDIEIVSGISKNFPAVLSRYVSGRITLRYKGP